MRQEDLLQSGVQLWMGEPFLPDELSRAMSMAKKRLAPGLDQIDYSIISNLPDEYRTHLLSLYNKILSQGVLLNSWLDSLVVLISKPGGESVRPISLLSCFAKIMEYMIYFRLRWFLESRPISCRRHNLVSNPLDLALIIWLLLLQISELASSKILPLLLSF